MHADNAAGEAFAPLFNFKSEATDNGRMKLSAGIITGLPRVMIKAGHDKVHEMLSVCIITQGGGTTKDNCFTMLNECILPEYPDVEDKQGKSVVIKLDAGPGRTELSNPDNRDTRALNKSGVSFYMGIPNGSGPQQEEDEIFGEY